jgi:hypothetical protein
VVVVVGGVQNVAAVGALGIHTGLKSSMFEWRTQWDPPLDLFGIVLHVNTQGAVFLAWTWVQRLSFWFWKHGHSTCCKTATCPPASSLNVGGCLAFFFFFCTIVVLNSGLHAC